MHATRTDVFALKNSGLEPFLYAGVGAETNGSTLTILSVLARLGKDPWAEAARWARLPKAAVIDSLAQSIAQMPLTPSALAGARDIAARLVQLLPSHMLRVQGGSAAQTTTITPKVVRITILYCVFALWMALNVLFTVKPARHAPAATEQSVRASEATHAATGSLKKAAVTGRSAAPDGQ